MPSIEARSAGAAVRRDGDALLFSGALDRPAVAALWSQALPLVGGVVRLDLTVVDHLDSAGLAMLAELAARAGGLIAVVGDPSNLAELRAAYRLAADLAFAA
ncbi:MAG: STAS domain-containing protein [Lysobacter sp.]|nr:STAS domain-containing protein [Lysobacter sp.]